MNPFKFSLSLCAAIGAIGFAGCASNTPATPTAPAAVDATAPVANAAATQALDAKPKPAATMMNARDMKPDTKNYRVRGQVKGVEKSIGDGRMTLIVSHENIPDFMQAMEMRIPFAKSEDASKVKSGDKIAFDMNRTNLEASNFETLPPATALKLKK